MSGFQNPLDMNTNTYPMFSYPDPNIPGVNPLWIDGVSHTMGLPNTYVPTGQQGQMIYPFNVLQNSPGFAPHFNLNNMLQTNTPLQSSLLNSGSALFQSTPNLTSAMSLASPLANNPQFMHYNLHNSRDLMIPQTGNQIVPTAYSNSHYQLPLSLPHVNTSKQQEILLQQQLQYQQNLQQQQNNLPQQNNLQQQSLQTPNQQPNKVPHSDDTYYYHKEGSNTFIAEAPNQNVTNFPKQIAARTPDQNIAETQTEYSVNITSTDDKPGPFYIAAVQPTSQNTSVGNLNHPRQNTLPGSFPTSLNPSLQLKNEANLVEYQNKFHKLDHSPSSPQRDFVLSTPKETKVESQGGRKSTSLLSPVATLSAVSSQLTQASDYIVTKPIYDKPRNKDHCLRCGKKVYPMERAGPIKEVVYHKTCFNCVTCGSTLNLKNFHHNPNDIDDLSIFCISHKPKERTRSCDANAVHIKAALTAPKLDKVNEQIRSDRQPSEVLIRSGYTQPAASALSPTREHFYYGMQTAENSQSDPIYQPRPNQTHQHQHEEQRHQQLQLQEQSEPVMEPQQQEQHQEIQQPLEQVQLRKQLPEPSHKLQHQLQQNDQELYNQLVQQNFYLQQQIRQNEETLINGVANITVAEDEEKNNSHAYVKVAAQVHDAHTDDVFTSHDQIHKDSVKGDDEHNRKSTTSSSSSSLSSSIIHQEIRSEESLDGYLATHFKLDNHNPSNQQKQYRFNNSGVQTFREREIVSSQSSRSTSPMQIQTGSRSTDDNESRRSSFSSNLSSRDSVELGASATSYSGQQQLSASHNERADRPSAVKNAIISDASNGKNLSARMIDLSKIDYNIEVPQGGADSDRYLPKNERMRMDRPSQYI